MEIFVLRWCLGNSGKGMNVPEMTFDVANANVNVKFEGNETRQGKVKAQISDHGFYFE